MQWRCFINRRVFHDIFIWKKFFIRLMKLCPDFLKNPLKFLRWIITLLGISSSIVYLSHFIHTHEIMHKTIFNIQCQGFIEMFMSDDIKRSVFLQHSMLPGFMFDSVMIMLSRTCKDIV